jgi:hypothetical protein
MAIESEEKDQSKSSREPETQRMMSGITALRLQDALEAGNHCTKSSNSLSAIGLLTLTVYSVRVVQNMKDVVMIDSRFAFAWSGRIDSGRSFIVGQRQRNP